VETIILRMYDIILLEKYYFTYILVSIQLQC